MFLENFPEHETAFDVVNLAVRTFKYWLKPQNLMDELEKDVLFFNQDIPNVRSLILEDFIVISIHKSIAKGLNEESTIEINKDKWKGLGADDDRFLLYKTLKLKIKVRLCSLLVPLISYLSKGVNFQMIQMSSNDMAEIFIRAFKEKLKENTR